MLGKHLEKKWTKRSEGNITTAKDERSKQEVYRLKCESKILRPTTEGAFNSAVRESGTSKRYVQRLSEALEPH